MSKINVEKGRIIDALSKVSDSIDTGKDAKATKGILIESDGKSKLTFITTNIQTTSIKTINAKGSQMKFLIPGKEFCDYINKVSKLNFEEFEFEKKDNNITIKCGDVCQTKMQLLKVNDFPKIKEDDSKVIDLKIKEKSLKEGIKYTTFAASGEKEGTALLLRTVHWELIREKKEDELYEKLIMVSTNGHRVALMELDVEKVNESLEGILKTNIPISSLNLIAKELSISSDEECKIAIGDKFVTLYKNDGSTYHMRVMEGEYINYRKIIPSQNDFKTHMQIGVNELQNAVNVCSIFNFLLKFELIDEKLKLSSKNKDKENQTKIEVNVTQRGEHITLYFDSTYLDVIKIIDTEEILMSFIEPLKPALIRPVQGLKFMYLILPINPEKM
ncbi:MAG: DNA polymerase III subunit beta [Clostridia bacterium]|nr:DNA polymerase III subunit beta [Clostridia bacterium]